MPYLHFTRWDVTKLNVPGTFSTSAWKLSNYWTSKLRGGWERPGFRIVNDQRGLIAKLLQPNAPPSPQEQQLEELLIYAKYTAELLKEFVYEGVRQEIDPGLPSRTKCVFAFDDSLDPDRCAKEMAFPTAGHSLIRIDSVPGNTRTLRARLSLLQNGQDRYDTLAARGRLYWAGLPNPAYDSEVLLEGELRVLEVVRRAGTA